MLVDARRLGDGTPLQADVCIVGAGAAGLALVRELGGSGLETWVVETGGLRPDPAEEKLRGFEQRGPERLEQTSARRFGGSAQLWGGNSAPYDAVDFDPSPAGGGPEWPIARTELDAFQARAHAFLGLGPLAFEEADWAEQPDFAGRRLALDPESVHAKLYQHRLLRLGDLHRDLARQAGVNVLLHATALRLETGPDGRRVTRLQVGCLGGTRLVVSARVFVLAAGIQNARLLLLSDEACPEGLGNRAGHVGRHLVTHLNFFSGFVLDVAPARDLSLYGLPEDLGRFEELHARVFAGLRLAESRQRKEGLAGYVAWLAPLSRRVARKAPHLVADAERLGIAWPRGPDAGDARERILARLLGARPTRRHPHRAGAYAIRNWVEQVPRAECGLALAEKRDPLGMRKLRARWEVGALERLTALRGQAILADALAQSGVGRLVSLLPPAGASWPSPLLRNSHYMGTTRMSAEARDGVVDRHCRVHEVENLYVAGGSVLPRAGVMMVTYNIVLLALRLADELKRVLR